MLCPWCQGDVGPSGQCLSMACPSRSPTPRAFEAVRPNAAVTAMKLRALAAHAAIWRAMNLPPNEALAALQDDGIVHQAIHDILAVETEEVTVPEEWRAHLERQDQRIDYLEAEVARLRAK